MSNLNEQKIFGYINAGKPIPRVKVKSKTHGNLLLDNRPVIYNKPFAILQTEKKTTYAHIFPRSRLHIVAVTT